MNILICPLDWGLGHASRCIPIIKLLHQSGHKVTIAGQGRSLLMLQKEFPHLDSIPIIGFSPSYPKSGKLIIHLFCLLPKFIFSLVSDYRQLKSILNNQQFDLVISDNRYGLWNRKTKNILITHQIMVKVPRLFRFAEYPVHLVSKLMINLFDECWIPDHTKGPGLSGDLSHKYPLPQNARFIGSLSRFADEDISLKTKNKSEEILAVISGPEPQRSIFEAILTHQLVKLGRPATLVGGTPESNRRSSKISNLTIIPFLESEELKNKIHTAAIVICRSGYSSIMDLSALGAKALFVPTPGQTEQEYLAKMFHEEGIAMHSTQDSLDLDSDIDKALVFKGFSNNQSPQLLLNVIQDLQTNNVS